MAVDLACYCILQSCWSAAALGASDSPGASRPRCFDCLVMGAEEKKFIISTIQIAGRIRIKTNVADC